MIKAVMTTYAFIHAVLNLLWFSWQGWYFTYASLPFSWKASAFMYNTVGLTETHFIRSLVVLSSQYIDDLDSLDHQALPGIPL